MDETSPVSVLIAEDDPDIVEILGLYLTGAGYRVISAPDGEAALSLLREEQPSVALVDIMMPRMNGYDFIRAARTFSDCPIVIVSARSEPADKVIGLDAGADGYITKPFDPMEVTAYIRAVLRRSRAGSPGRVAAAGDLSLDLESLAFARAGRAISLTVAETKIMAMFLANPGRVFTKEQIYARATGDAEAPATGCEACVMVHISNIRAKIEDDPSHPRYITTVRGMGYRLDA